MIVNDRPEIDIHVLPGGQMPKRQTEGAIGYDVYLRAIVSPFEMEPDGILRKTLFDFTLPNKYNLPNKELMKHIQGILVEGSEKEESDEEDLKLEWVYWLEPGESVLAGIGFITAMPFPMFYLVAPRSGLASKHRITIGNAPGTVDPDYRGEVGVVLVNEGMVRFQLKKDMRIAQIVFITALIPQINLVSIRTELDETERGSGGFGSTGLYDEPDRT